MRRFALAWLLIMCNKTDEDSLCEAAVDHRLLQYQCMVCPGILSSENRDQWEHAPIYVASP